MKLQQKFKNFKKHEKHQNFSFSILFLKNFMIMDDQYTTE